MKAKAILPMSEYLEMLERQKIDMQNISLIRQSFEIAIVLFANNKKEINSSLKKSLEEIGISLDINFRNNKKENITIEDIQYKLNFKKE